MSVKRLKRAEELDNSYQAEEATYEILNAMIEEGLTIPNLHNETEKAIMPAVKEAFPGCEDIGLEINMDGGNVNWGDVKHRDVYPDELEIRITVNKEIDSNKFLNAVYEGEVPNELLEVMDDLKIEINDNEVYLYRSGDEELDEIVEEDTVAKIEEYVQDNAEALTNDAACYIDEIKISPKTVAEKLEKLDLRPMFLCSDGGCTLVGLERAESISVEKLVEASKDKKSASLVAAGAYGAYDKETLKAAVKGMERVASVLKPQVKDRDGGRS